MNIFKYRLIKATLFILVATLIGLSMFPFFIQNRMTPKQAKGENTSSHANREITQDNALVPIQIPLGTQMGDKQVAAIRRVIKAKSNVLVWGLGNDSPFWHDTTQGKVVFIEPAGFWFNKIINEYPYLETYTVNYTTELEKSFEKYIHNTELWPELDIRSQLPPVIRNTDWDVIIVDAPPGYAKGQPGRYQSIYTSSLLAHNGTHIFVDDYDRKVEREFSTKMLGEPFEVVSRPPKRYPGNQQAHFLHIEQWRNNRQVRSFQTN